MRLSSGICFEGAFEVFSSRQRQEGRTPSQPPEVWLARDIEEDYELQPDVFVFFGAETELGSGGFGSVIKVQPIWHQHLVHTAKMMN